MRRALARKNMPKKLDLSVLRHKFRLSVFGDDVKKGSEVPAAGGFGSGELLEVFFVDHGDCEDAEVYAGSVDVDIVLDFFRNQVWFDHGHEPLVLIEDVEGASRGQYGPAEFGDI